MLALDALRGEPRLRDYQPYWAARASLLARTDRVDEAREAYRLAVGLEMDEAVWRYLHGCLLRL